MHCSIENADQGYRRIWRALPSFQAIVLGKKFLTILMLSIFFSLIAHHANAGAREQCLKTRIDPEIVFDVQNADIELNRSKNSTQIKRFVKKVNAFRPPKGHNLLGLAYVAMQHKISVEMLASKIGNRYCTRLKKVYLLFGRQKNTIFVSRKYSAGTCEFKAILAHEKEHMAINARVQLKYEKKIKRELLNSAKVIQPFLTTNQKAAPKSLAARFAADIKPILKSFHEERAAENAHLDTPQSYKRTRSLCANW